MKTASLAGFSCMVVLLATSAAFTAEDVLAADFEGEESGHALADHIVQGDTPREDEISAAKKTSRLIKCPSLFIEDFNGIRNGGNGSQWQTGLRLNHSANLPGWTKTELNSIHALQRTSGNWALQLVGADGGDNVLTLNTSFAANVKGKTYAVSFDVGPSVWAGGQQATRADHQLSIGLNSTAVAQEKGPHGFTRRSGN